MFRKKTDVLPPISRGSDQAVEQQKRSARAGALVVDLRSIHQDEHVFDLNLIPIHFKATLPVYQHRAEDAVPLRFDVTG
jgi:hypothetical protein